MSAKAKITSPGVDAPVQAVTRMDTQTADKAEARDRILEAALKEFSINGLAGARTERIAAEAGVNKALLYYYFASKEKLYAAALETVAVRVRDSSLAVLSKAASPGERVLRAALNHFDRILTQREFQSLMQQEMIRLHRGEDSALDVLAEQVFRPLFAVFEASVREGIASGELIDVDWLEIPLAAMGINVFYFLSAPVWSILLNFDPFSVEALRTRRSTLVRFLAQAIFVDRKQGAKLAERILAETPEPKAIESVEAPAWRAQLKFEGKSK